MKVLRLVLVTLVTLGVLTTTSYAANFAVRHYDARAAGGTARAAEGSEIPAVEASPSTPTSPTTSPDPAPTTAPAASPQATIVPEDVLTPGDRGTEVRELQARLFQLAWLPEKTTGRYDTATRTAVSGFQDKRELKATGTVDPVTWKRLVAMTRAPSHDQMFNVLHAGPAILDAGADGDDVRDLQARLVAIQWLFGDVSGSYDDTTTEAVKGFQAKRAIPVTGAVDQRTMDRLHAMTSTPTHATMYNQGSQPGTVDAAALDARCETGRALCIDKTSQTLRWVVDGKVQQSLDVRFGASYSPTREGLFHVDSMDADHVSHLYGSEMPFSMFFSGGQAVHYSSDFAARGYAGASHGCVNVRDYDGLAHLFDEVNVGDNVVVYRS